MLPIACGMVFRFQTFGGFGKSKPLARTLQQFGF
jgi:hypothetical protein